MIAQGNPGLEAQVAAALDWWRNAGVDAVFHDEPVNWLSTPEDTRAPAAIEPAVLRKKEPEAAPPPPALDAQLPANLADFTTWWLAEPSLDGGRTAGRVPPRGPAGARLMVLVAEPEREDRETLLSDAEGRLLEAMLAAIGIAAEETYVASVLPRHTPHPDWDSLAAQGIGKVAAHHVALVRPRKLLTFGNNIPSLMSNDPPNSPAILRTFNHDSQNVPWLSGRSLGAMLERPRWKAGFWQSWLAFSHGLRDGPG